MHLIVRVHSGLACPECPRQLRSSDVVETGGGYRMICAGCHSLLWELEHHEATKLVAAE